MAQRKNGLTLKEYEELGLFSFLDKRRSVKTLRFLLRFDYDAV
jgi:hypothetical protein